MAYQPEQFDYVILSDLHLSEGKNPSTQRVSRLENFLFDRSFERLLLHLQVLAEQKGRPWTLIINGDMLDFLRVTSIPDPAHLPKGLPYLTPTKRRYGLGTSPAESKWQLERIVEGHPVFFRALARFLLAGQHLIIIKGNHDVNWFWPEVRYRFFELIETFLSEILKKKRKEENKISQALDRIEVRSWAFYIKDLLYVEHGNQYDSSNAFRNFLYPLFSDPDSPVDRYELDLPFGSFFVRYFFNKVQFQSPMAPNYRHTSSYFYSLWRRHFYETWNIVRNYFPYFFRTLRKIQVRRGTKDREMREQNLRHIGRVGQEYGNRKAFEQIARFREPLYESKLEFFKLIVQRPLKKAGMALGGILLFSFFWSLLSEWILSSEMNLLFRSITSLIVNYGFILLGIFLVLFTLRPSKVGTSYREAKPETLRNKAARIGEILKVKYVVFGHCHMEDVWKIPGQNAWYMNTGTWVPLIDEEINPLRPEVQFPVVVLEGDEATLMRWNDTTCELEELMVYEDRSSV